MAPVWYETVCNDRPDMEMQEDTPNIVQNPVWVEIMEHLRQMSVWRQFRQPPVRQISHSSAPCGPIDLKMVPKEAQQNLAY